MNVFSRTMQKEVIRETFLPQMIPNIRYVTIAIDIMKIGLIMINLSESLITISKIIV